MKLEKKSFYFFSPHKNTYAKNLDTLLKNLKFYIYVQNNYDFHFDLLIIEPKLNYVLTLYIF